MLTNATGLLPALLLVPLVAEGEQREIPPGHGGSHIHALPHKATAKTHSEFGASQAELGAHWYVLGAAANTDCFLSRRDPRYERNAESLLREGRTKYPTSSLLLQGARATPRFGEPARDQPCGRRIRSSHEPGERRLSGGTPGRPDRSRAKRDHGLPTPVVIWRTFDDHHPGMEAHQPDEPGTSQVHKNAMRTIGITAVSR